MITAIIGSSGAQIAFSDTPIGDQPSGVTVAADARIVNRPTITMSLDPVAASYEAGGCTLEICDDQGIISGYIAARMAAGSDLYRQPVLLRVNEIELHYQVGDYSRAEDLWSISLVEAASLVRSDIVSHIISRDQFPDAPDVSVGRAIPIVYGVVAGDYGGVRCPRVGVDTFIVASHPCQAIHGCWVGQDRPSTSWTHYTSAAPQQWTYIHTQSDSDYVMASVSGRMDAEGHLIVNPIQVAADLCAGSGVDLASDGDTASLAAALDSRGVRLDFAQDEPIALKTIIPEIASCAGILWRYDTGKIRFFDPFASPASVHHLAVDGWEERTDFSAARNVADYRWRYDYDSRRYLRAEIVRDEASVTAYGRVPYEADLPCVRDDRAALAAISQAVQSGGRPKAVTCRMMIQEYAALGLHVGSVIRLDTDKPGLGGASDYLITRVTIDQASDAVSLQLISWYGTRTETPRRWLVQTSTSTGGTISPQGMSLVADGGTLTITVTASTGYSLSHLYVDGVDHKADVVSGTYQVGPISSGHIVHAEFAADTPRWTVVTWVADHVGGYIEQQPHGARVYDSETYDDGVHIYGWVWPDPGKGVLSFLVDGAESKSQLVRDSSVDMPSGAEAYRWDIGDIHRNHEVGVQFG